MPSSLDLSPSTKAPSEGGCWALSAKAPWAAVAKTVASCKAVSAKAPWAAVAKTVASCKAVSAKAPWAAVAKAVAFSVAAVPKPSTTLAAGESTAVITPTIGAVEDPVPPFAIGSTPLTSSVKSTLLTVKVWSCNVIKSCPRRFNFDPEFPAYKA